MVDEGLKAMEIKLILSFSKGKDLKFLDVAKGKGSCQVKFCPQWDCTGHLAARHCATAHKAAPEAGTAAGTLLPSGLPGCCLTYQDSKRF